MRDDLHTVMLQKLFLGSLHITLPLLLSINPEVRTFLLSQSPFWPIVFTWSDRKELCHILLTGHSKSNKSGSSQGYNRSHFINTVQNTKKFHLNYLTSVPGCCNTSWILTFTYDVKGPPLSSRGKYCFFLGINNLTNWRYSFWIFLCEPVFCTSFL